MNSEQLDYHGRHESGETAEPREGYLPKHLSGKLGEVALEMLENNGQEEEPELSKEEILELVNRHFDNGEECAETFLKIDRAMSRKEEEQDSDFAELEKEVRRAANEYHGHDNAIIQIAKFYAERNEKTSDEFEEAFEKAISEGRDFSKADASKYEYWRIQDYKEVALKYGDFGSLDDCRDELGMDTEDIARNYASEEEILVNRAYLHRKLGAHKTLELVEIFDNDETKAHRLMMEFGKETMSEELHRQTTERNYGIPLKLVEFGEAYMKEGFAPQEFAESFNPTVIMDEDNFQYLIEQGVSAKELVDYMVSYIRLDYKDSSRRVDKNHDLWRRNNWARPEHANFVNNNYTYIAEVDGERPVRIEKGAQVVAENVGFLTEHGVEYRDIAEAFRKHGGKDALYDWGVSEMITRGGANITGLLEAFEEEFELSEAEKGKFYKSVLKNAVDDYRYNIV